MKVLSVFKVLILLVTVITTTAPRPANAVALSLVAGPSGVIAGVVAFGTLTTVGAVSGAILEEEDGEPRFLIQFIPFTLLGIILLDKKDNGPSFTYASISDDKASELGLSISQQKNFNKKEVLAAVNQINKAITKKCTAKIQKVFARDNRSNLIENDLELIESCAEKGWKDFQRSNPQILNEDVFSVIQTIRSQN